MKLKDSIAAKCRYGEEALRAFGENSDLIWECSEDDYQGSANILVKTRDFNREVFIHYEWTYGSCSGCDEWESRDLTDFEIIQEMIRDCNQFNSREELERYLNLTTGEEKLPRPTDFDNGSVPGMMRVLSGGIVDEFYEMANAYYKWKNGQEYDPQECCRC